MRFGQDGLKQCHFDGGGILECRNVKAVAQRCFMGRVCTIEETLRFKWFTDKACRNSGNLM